MEYVVEIQRKDSKVWHQVGGAYPSEDRALLAASTALVSDRNVVRAAVRPAKQAA